LTASQGRRKMKGSHIPWQAGEKTASGKGARVTDICPLPPGIWLRQTGKIGQPHPPGSGEGNFSPTCQWREGKGRSLHPRTLATSARRGRTGRVGPWMPPSRKPGGAAGRGTSVSGSPEGHGRTATPVCRSAPLEGTLESRRPAPQGL